MKGLFFVVAVWAMMVSAGSLTAGDLKRETLVLISDGKRIAITVEVAETERQKAVGLMFRTELDRRAGMLFAYKRPQELTMWMRNTYIPLDMVFIRADGVIHRIEANTEPFSEKIIASKGNVTAVLELAGGVAAELGLKAGDRVEHAAFKTKAR